MQVFWKKGYVATSYSDLTIATGLTKPSLYNAYGDKKNMYLRCLDVFCRTVIGPIYSELINEKVSGRIAVEAFVMSLLSDEETALTNRGSLIVNTIMEASALGDKVIHSAATKMLQGVEDTIARRLKDGPGAAVDDYEAMITARLIMTGILGLRVKNKIRGKGSPDQNLMVKQFIQRTLSGMKTE